MLEEKALELAKETLLNKKVSHIRYMTDEEMQSLNWRKRSIVLQMDDGTLVFPSIDNEGNDGGSLQFFKENSSEHCIPVL